MDSTLKKRLFQTGVALLLVFGVGTFGYYSITDGAYNLFTCFYMTMLTVTTIGFDEIIPVKNYEAGRPFTVFIAFFGIGVLTYFVSTIAAVIIEGKLRESYKKRKMDKSIVKYKDHYIICGVGSHSMHILEEFAITKRDNVCIEINPEVITEFLQKYPLQKYVEGDASHESVLIKAGVERAKGLFATTNDDNTNLVICLIARRLNPGIKIISLCNKHENLYKIKLAGADNVLSTNYMGGMRMVSEMLRPSVTHFIDALFNDEYKNLRLEQINLSDEQIGKTIGELKLKEYKDTLLISVKSGDEIIFRLNDDYEIKKGDSMLVITTPDERIKLEEQDT